MPWWWLSDTNGGLCKKWCQSWHCDASLSSTLVLKVLQVFFSWAYMGGGGGFKIIIGWEFALWNRRPRVKAGIVNPLVMPLTWRCRGAEWILLFQSKNLQSARERIWMENVTICHWIKGGAYGMPTQQNACCMWRQRMLQRKLMSNLPCDY